MSKQQDRDMPPVRAEAPARPDGSPPVPYDAPRLPEARVRERRSKRTIAIIVAAAIVAVVAAILFIPW